MQLPSNDPFGSIDELHAERLECFRVCWHRELAVAAAMYYCTQHKLDGAALAESTKPVTSCSRFSEHAKQREARPGQRCRGALSPGHDRLCAMGGSARGARKADRDSDSKWRSFALFASAPTSLLQEREKMLSGSGTVGCGPTSAPR